MALKVWVIGAYGNFGRIVCRHLSREPGIELTLAGRNAARLEALAAALGGQPQRWCGDAHSPAFAEALREQRAQLVIHTGGPFQGQAYTVAEHCLAAGAHYCDLADCRTFVNGIGVLDAQAQAAGVALLSGCSSVPTLSSALIDEHRARFARIEHIEHGISSSAKMPGLSTVQGVLAYAGQPILQRRGGQPQPVPGWQGLVLRRLPGLGWRLLANVDVPDMDLFGPRYGARSLSFKAGPGLMAGALANWLLAAARRLRLVDDPTPWAARLHRLGLRCERFGDGLSAMYIDCRGHGQQGQPLRLRLQLTASHDKGPEIPSCAAVALARKLAAGYRPAAGARPCVGELSVAEYLAAIGDEQHVRLTAQWHEGRG
ncbi:saccharopine dehydrogenase NADP-binding domain-containing protein [Pseudomonas sp. NPDC007930]|uniref:saccharopine dehydrogenase NADP-binding domain-containing protein n=1 Tax=Pseudomonas sp. NPDC007930 TaxID=3364417 RepID=UPI0036E0B559